MEAGAAVDAVDSSGRTPLFRAAALGQVASARLLMEARADPDLMAEPLGLSPRLVAAETKTAAWCEHLQCCAEILAEFGGGS